MNIKFYIKRKSDITPDNTDYIDLEEHFNGMKYSKCVGLEDLGKPKNIYTETYADADELRVHIPNNVKREATAIIFTFLFLGDDRQKVYNEFNDFVANDKLYYYDTARNKRAYMVLMDKTEPKEDVYKGSTPYMSVDYKFQNLWGECEDYKLQIIGDTKRVVLGHTIKFNIYWNNQAIEDNNFIVLINNRQIDINKQDIQYIPKTTGRYTACAKYYKKGVTIVSNIFEFEVTPSHSPLSPQPDEQSLI